MEFLSIVYSKLLINCQFKALTVYFSIGCLLKCDYSNGTGRGSTPNYVIEVVCFLVR